MLYFSGASYAMMAGYFGGSGHIPESFKALMPEFQQYWGTSQEGTKSFHNINNAIAITLSLTIRWSTS